MSAVSTSRKIGLWAGPLLGLAILLAVDLNPANAATTRCAAVATLMAVWWMTEALPIAVTALLPMVLFPIMGISDGDHVASQYFNSVIFLFIGGFIVALAMQRWNLHRRIALTTIRIVGTSSRRMLLGFMIATFVMSMWVSNTPTTMMMVPIAMAVILRLRESTTVGDSTASQNLASALLLGIGFAASIGGTATLIGTPPNLILVRHLDILFPENAEVNFANWMLFALPFAIVFAAVTWFVLDRIFMRGKMQLSFDSEIIDSEYRRLGTPAYEERIVFAVFITMALMWIFRQPIEFGVFTIPGWSRALPTPDFIDDGVIAITLATTLFLIPSKNRKGECIMNWETTKELNWGVVILIGGGFALATGFVDSGLTQWLGQRLHAIATLPVYLLIPILCVSITLLSEIASNTALAQLALPVLGAVAISADVNPLLLMIPATLAASSGFMLPVATPPNAIVFGTGHIKLNQMIRAGFRIDLIGALLITLATLTLGGLVFSFE